MRLLVGAGSHAKLLVEIQSELGEPIDAYVDPVAQDWLTAQHIPDDEAAAILDPGNLVLGLGGYKTPYLRKRLDLFQAYLDKGWNSPPLVHPSAIISSSATLGEGVCVLAGAVIQPHAMIGNGVIINSRAVVEHDSSIGSGTHVAPGAIVLGDCHVGETSMIGSGAIILQGVKVPDNTLVKALERYPV